MKYQHGNDGMRKRTKCNAAGRNSTAGPVNRWFWAALLGGCFLLACAATAAGQTPPTPATTSQETRQTLAKRLAGPFLQLAEALAASGREQAASDTRRWIPPHRVDGSVAYFSQLKLEIPAASLAEPKVKEAFINARRATAMEAAKLARQAAAEGYVAEAYQLLWRSLREDPTSNSVRQQLGLGSGNTARVSVRPGRQAPEGLGWPPRSFLIAQSTHFRIFSTASRRDTVSLAEDLERFYEVWSQLFLSQWAHPQELGKQLAAGGPASPPQAIAEVVYFADRESYLRAMGAENSMVQQSTGNYSPAKRLTLLFAGADADLATRYHEITHQLLQELCGPVVADPGLDEGFWLVEGIATYMESVRFLSSYATVGGWDSPRLQHARARWLPQPAQLPSLTSLLQESRQAVQQRDDLATWYTVTAAYAHLLMDQPEISPLLQRYLQSIYRGRAEHALLSEVPAAQDWSAALGDFLALREKPELALPAEAQLELLCLGRTAVGKEPILRLAPQPALTWLDLYGLPLGDQELATLLGTGSQLQRLNLERTAIGNEIAPLLARQRDLSELDLSYTAVDDRGLAGIRRAVKLETLWLTGSRITDESVPLLLNLPALQVLDVQRTGISEQGLARLRDGRPQLQLNPLQLSTVGPAGSD
ncbi:leucine-rich repeat domain-containing protein [Planctomycetaceae bacterium SH139]